MARGGEAADWTSDPKDVENLIRYFHTQRSRFGDGGNPDKQLCNDAAAHFRSLGAPKHGGPKTSDSIRSRWTVIRKLHDYILQALQKTYPGASGWTYTHELGFNVTPESKEAWLAFVKAGNSHFKPFANRGWVHWELVHEILPTRAKGKYVFNGASSGSQAHGDLDESVTSSDVTQLSTESQLSDTSSQSSAPSQPISNWSQSDDGCSQLHDDFDDGLNNTSSLDQLASAALQHSQSPSATPETPVGTLLPVAPPVFPAPPATPANPRKHLTSDEMETPWSNKRTRTTGPEAIMFLGRGVMDIGGALRDCFGNKSSGLSPTKKLAQARDLAEKDVINNYITSDVRLRLSLLFARDPSAADAYIAERDGYSRADLARILLPDFFF
ncbi:hypothetical protein B0H19DRAFT_1074691 [Mycena capillaripes]|nr:hypothetical protein B0H19DRAFT_1074691 [Mycena capillaripes]